jgi:hypothetical protein
MAGELKDPKRSAQAPKAGDSARTNLIVLVVWLVPTSGIVVELIEGHTSPLAHLGPRLFVLVWMVLFGWLYYKFAETKVKLVIGILEIGAGLASNFDQLGRLAGEQRDVYERLALLAGGVIVLSKGIKDVIKGYEKFRQQPDAPKAPFADDSSDA